MQALGVPTLEYTVGSFQVGGRPIENFDGDGGSMLFAGNDCDDTETCNGGFCVPAQD